MSSVLLAIFLLSFAVVNGSAEAKPKPSSGLIGCEQGMGRRDDFFDFEYAQKVWCEMNTLDALNTERAKYAAVFGPWFERYKETKDRFAMYDELRAYEEPERTPMRRGHDVELAYKAWLCEHHNYWGRLYRHSDAEDPETFDKYLARPSLPPVGGYTPRTPLSFGRACGGIKPDWRSPEMKAADKAMMEAADKERCGGPCKKKDKKRKAN